MCHDNITHLRTIISGKQTRNSTESIHIQSAIHLIQKHIFGLEKLELEDLDLASLSSTETYIDITPEELSVDRKLCHERLNDLLEADKRLLGIKSRIINRTQKLKQLHALDLRDRLKRKEDTQLRSLMRIKFEDVLPIKHGNSISNFICRMSHESKEERGFTTTILTHDAVVFAKLEIHGYIIEDGLVCNRDAKVID
jgi:hypothetical protein